MRNEIDVAANFLVLAVRNVKVQVVFLAGVTRNLPEMRHVPFSDHVGVPVDTGTTNEVKATLRDRFAATDFTVKPEYARTVVAVALLELLFDPTISMSYARPFTSFVRVHVVAVVVHDEVVPVAVTVYDTSLPVAADHETVSDLSPDFTVTPGTAPTCASGVTDTCCDALAPNEFTLSTVKTCASPPVRPVITHLVSDVVHTTFPDEFFTLYDVVFAVADHDNVTDPSPAVALGAAGAVGNAAVVAVSGADASDVPLEFVDFAVTE